MNVLNSAWDFLHTKTHHKNLDIYVFLRKKKYLTNGEAWVK